MASLLIVDDQPINLQLLVIGFTRMDYTVHVATSGCEAIELAIETKPDLILLDVMMPEIDGFEVCRRMKAMPDLADIPVIFLTALNDTIDKVRGLEVGGEDYITKPFSLEEVKARIKIHLALREKQKQLELLREQDRLYAIHMNNFRNEILDQLQHDVMSPLTSIKNSIYLLTRTCDSGNPMVPEYIRRADLAVEDVIAMIGGLLDIARLEMSRSTQFQMIEVAPFLEEVVTLFKSISDVKKIRVEVDLEMIDPSCRASFDPEQIASVLKNLLSNAIKYTNSGGTVLVSATIHDDRLHMVVSDTGNGISEEHIAHIFERFYRIPSDIDRVEGTGLGLYIAQTIVEKHGRAFAK